MRTIFSHLAAVVPKLPKHGIFPRDEGRIFTKPYDTANGSIIFPRAWPLTFREGSSVNISWSTDYNNINLYYYQQGKVAESVQLVTNLATNWYQWDVHAEETNLTNPFVFRVVNAQGTAEERNKGGFYSTSWFLIRDDASRSASSTSPTSSSSSSTRPVAASVYTALPPSATSQENLSSTTRGTSAEATATPTSTAVTNIGVVNKFALIALIVGAVIMGAIIIAGIWYLLRRRRRSRTNALLSKSSPVVYCRNQANQQKESKPRPFDDIYAHSSELQGVAPCYELPDKRYSG